MKYQKLSKNVKADSGDIFKKGSVIQILATGSKNNPSYEIMPIDAYDEENLPFLNGTSLYTFSNYKESEHEYTKPLDAVIADYGYPGMAIENENDDDGITIGLRDAYADKDYELTLDGNVKKKAVMNKVAESFNNNLSESDKITTDFDSSVDGEDEPGTTDNYKEDVAEKPTPAPMSGSLAIKVKNLKRKVASEENKLTANDDDASIDYDRSIDGSDTVDKSTYKADESEKPTPAPLLGELAMLKKEIKKLVNKVKRAEASDSFKIDNVTDGDSGGDNLDDFSLEGNVEEGSNDTFRPKEVKSKKKKLKKTSNEQSLTPKEQKRLDELEADYENLDLLEVGEYQRLMKKIHPDEEALQDVE